MANKTAEKSVLRNPITGNPVLPMTTVDQILTADGTAKWSPSDAANDGKLIIKKNNADTGIEFTANSATDVTVNLGLGEAADKDIVKATTGTDTSNLTTEKRVEEIVDGAIANIPSPMVFKGSLGVDGTITALPTADKSNEGFTYKVITDGTYALQTAKVGDVFISNGTKWDLIPSGDEPNGTVTNIAVGDGLVTADGNPITATGVISHKAKASTAASSKNTGRTYIQSIEIDNLGHIAKIETGTETVEDTNTTYTFTKGTTDGTINVKASDEASGTDVAVNLDNYTKKTDFIYKQLNTITVDDSNPFFSVTV